MISQKRLLVSFSACALSGCVSPSLTPEDANTTREAEERTTSLTRASDSDTFRPASTPKSHQGEVLDLWCAGASFPVSSQ